jgi:hypothetical protein
MEISAFYAESQQKLYFLFLINFSTAKIVKISIVYLMMNSNGLDLLKEYNY